MTRLRAFFFHLCVSSVFGGMLLVLFWYVWYPAPLFRALGGVNIFLMLLGIDVVLGPLLTLIVFKAGKKSLRFDLSVIAVVQLLALTYGVHTLLIGRPVYVAALGHRFDVITANEVELSELAVARKSLPWFGVEWVGTRYATDPKEHERILFSAIGGRDYGYFPQYHVPLDLMREEIIGKAKPVANLVNFNPGRGEELRTWLAAHGRNELNTVFQGLKARSEDMAVILDKKTGEVIGIAPFKPWD